MPMRAVTAEHLIDVLADLHAVDVDEVGLGDLARRDGYIERQLKRWSKQWELSKTRELPAIEEVEERLKSRVPVQQGTAIVHGDYRLGNCLVDPDAGRVNAVLDWELCTLGDPLADVGYLSRVLDRPGPGGPAGQRPDRGRRVPVDGRHDRAVLRAHGARRGRHRVLRRLLVVAAGRDQRGRVRPLRSTASWPTSRPTSSSSRSASSTSPRRRSPPPASLVEGER